MLNYRSSQGMGKKWHTKSSSE